ncbi:unnamed protein product [Owenia fusiformis]|uniref:allantoinase n=1 Tax=Owenia fusiformis TaxID=6347 RepID=A0A8S4N4Z0_OWEFU|nr:unnamed protein product [Owenia fusiformis]
MNKHTFSSFNTYAMKVFRGKRVVVDGEIIPATVFVEGGKIVDIQRNIYSQDSNSVELESEEVVDAGDLVLMPGVVDSHVHVNEPGRTAWEGFSTATKAAAVGGITTIVDMPLNSIPSTTSLSSLNIKLDSARGQCYVDVGFWGGVVPGNQDELVPMVNAGVAGFKCFLINSGVEEFQHVTEEDLHIAMKQLVGTESVLLFHAEVDCAGLGQNNTKEETAESADDRKYQTFLESRPDKMEVEAIKLVCKLCLQYKVRCHIVHLSACEALPIIQSARDSGAPLTVETTHHYLNLASENIPDGATYFKCCPPVRNKKNRDLLWKAVMSREIDMVVSDHSPCTSDLKHLDKGDFLAAWGGISSVQFGLSLFWTAGQQYDVTILDLCRCLCENTSKLAGLGSQKGSITVGRDADFVIWDPEKSWSVKEQMIQHKNKLTPYIDTTLKGNVSKTILRGNVVYDEHTGLSEKPFGQLLLDIKFC